MPGLCCDNRVTIIIFKWPQGPFLVWGSDESPSQGSDTQYYIGILGLAYFVKSHSFGLTVQLTNYAEIFTKYFFCLYYFVVDALMEVVILFSIFCGVSVGVIIIIVVGVK